MSFNTLDIIFTVIILLLGIHGAIVGFIKEFFSKAAFLIALLLSIFFFDEAGLFLNHYIKSSLLANVLGFILIFIIVYVIIKIIQGIIGKLFSIGILKGLDRSFGFFLGLLEGFALVLLLFIIIFSQKWIPVGPLFTESFFYSLLSPLFAEPVQTVRGYIALETLKNHYV